MVDRNAVVDVTLDPIELFQAAAGSVQELPVQVVSLDDGDNSLDPYLVYIDHDGYEFYKISTCIRIDVRNIDLNNIIAATLEIEFMHADEPTQIYMRGPRVNLPLPTTFADLQGAATNSHHAWKFLSLPARTDSDPGIQWQMGLSNNPEGEDITTFLKDYVDDISSGPVDYVLLYLIAEEDIPLVESEYKFQNAKVFVTTVAGLDFEATLAPITLTATAQRTASAEAVLPISISLESTVTVDMEAEVDVTLPPIELVSVAAPAIQASVNVTLDPITLIARAAPTRVMEAPSLLVGITLNSEVRHALEASLTVTLDPIILTIASVHPPDPMTHKESMFLDPIQDQAFFVGDDNESPTF